MAALIEAQKAIHPDALFNRPTEIGIRSLTVLAQIANQIDLQRLAQYDYILVHSDEVGGPESLHPSNPVRLGELVARRGILDSALSHMVWKGLVHKEFSPSGVTYAATEAGRAFITHLQSSYARKLLVRAAWIAANVHPQNDVELAATLKRAVGEWRYEFEGGYMTEEEP